MNTQDNSIELGENLSNCLNCPESIDKTDFYLKYDVCPFCNFHYSIDSKKRIQIISDSGTFREFNKNISIKRPENLKIDDTYRKNVKKTRERTGLEEAAISGTCNIGGIKTVVIILDFGFLGGSMGLIVGEKISKAFSFAYRNNLPVVSIISSGGRRVQEGLYSLVQMIKTVISTKDLRKRNLPHITLFTNPSGGQVYSSFASRADIKLGEPGAIMGLFQLDELMNANEEASNLDISSETFYEKGLIDKVVSRNNLKIELFTILENLMIDYKIPKKVDLSVPTLNSNKDKKKVKKAIKKGTPSSSIYISKLFDDYVELGYKSKEDLIITGLGKIASQPVAIVAQNYQRSNSKETGKITIKDLSKINKFMNISEDFNIPIIFFVDNKGIDISYKNELLGVGDILSKMIFDLSSLKQNMISIITGEASSEASIPFFLSDKVYMLENAIFIPNNQDQKKEYLDATDCLENNVIDSIIPEPPLGAAKGPEDMARLIKISLINGLSELNHTGMKKTLSNRNKKFLNVDMGENKLLLTVTNEMKIWKDVLEASYKAFRN